MTRTIAPFFALLALRLSAQVHLDLAPVEAWLRRAKEAPQRPASWEAASAATLGGQRAEAAWQTFGVLPEKVPNPPNPSAVEALIQALKTQDLGRLESDVSVLFPGVPAPPLPIHVVANGFPAWGDMYVRTFRAERGGQVLSTEGETCVILNAGLVLAGYGETLQKQIAGTLDVLRHEFFHVYFRARRAHLGLPDPSSPETRLLLATQDEGIAHLLGTRSQLVGPLPRVHVEKAFKDLEGALVGLRKGKADSSLLQRANVGPFWNKYSAISGLACAHAIEQAQGAEGLRACIGAGPADLILRYEALARKDARLVVPGPETIAWAKAHAGLR